LSSVRGMADKYVLFGDKNFNLSAFLLSDYFYDK
jgi:hypothetical protein